MFALLHDAPGRSDAPDAPDAQGGTRASEQAAPARRRPIVCARCAAELSDASQRTEVSGQHEHTFFNPAGVIYRVACLAAAPGCSGVGPFSGDFSWFPGFRWQIATCGSCHEHVGWHFEGKAPGFSALIADRIVELKT